MAGSVNKVLLIGRLGKDPEIKSFANGGRIANFSVATSETWKDRSTGERKERVEWINVSVKSDGLVGVVERYLKKGSNVYIEGKLQTRKWQDQNGNDRYSTEVVLGGGGGQLVMLGDPPNSNRSQGGGAARGGASGGSNLNRGSGGWGDDFNDGVDDIGRGKGGSYDDDDSDIPF